jgi:DNA (cytosine-5)-methyltransferase 1
MKYLSVCSGVEAATVAWHSLGWQPVAFSEIESFPSAVLAHHYPNVPNLGDMTKYKEWNLNESIDILVGGTPCQSFSVAGLRKGLEDPRGNLALTYVGILDKFRPQWFIWENVPGVLSSGGGRDFGSFLGAVAECGYGFAYRVLDAQNFGVPQRRRRVFVVGHLGDWQPAAKVLFESESLSGDIKSGRKTRKSVTGFVESSFGQYREDVIAGTTKASGGVLGGGSETFLTVYENHPSDSRVKPMGDVCQTVTSTWGTGGGNIPFVQSFGIPGNWIGRKPENGGNATTPMDNVSPCLTKTDRHGVAFGFEPGIAKREGNPNRFSKELSPTLRADMGDNQVAAAFGWQNSASQSMSADTITPTLDKSKTPAVVYSFDSLASNSMKSSNPYSGCREVELSKTIDTTYPCPSKNQGGIGIMQSMAVRRLTPVECERLQGFPDNYTQIPWNKKVSVDCPDGLRYKAMGNSMAVPVMNWIGKRISTQGIIDVK